MVIEGSDTVASVLARDEALVDVFVSVSPHFERLRNPHLRRAMARLVTVSAAARIAGVDEDELLARLNASVASLPTAAVTASRRPSAGVGDTRPDASLMSPIPPADSPQPPDTNEASQGAAGDPLDSTGSSTVERRSPAEPLASSGSPSGAPARDFVELDVREDLRVGREPLPRIMKTVKTLAPGQTFRLRSSFEPVPLYHVLGRQGFSHITERLAPDDWTVSFFRERADSARDPAQNAESATPELSSAGPGKPAPGHRGYGASPLVSEASAPGGRQPASDLPGSESALAARPDEKLSQVTPGALVFIDVRGLEPPEPMVRTLAALETLPAGSTLVQVNLRVPTVLISRLAELGFTHNVVIDEDGETVRTHIRRGG